MAKEIPSISRFTLKKGSILSSKRNFQTKIYDCRIYFSGKSEVRTIETILKLNHHTIKGLTYVQYLQKFHFLLPINN